MTPPASIVIPTRARLDYLEVALASIAAQAADAGAEVLVIDDAGPSLAARALAARFGARYEPHPAPLGLNVARNTRRGALERRAGGVRRRRHQGEPGVAASAARRRARAPRRGRVHRSDQALPRGSAAAHVRARGPADHVAGPGARGHPRAICMGRQHGDPPQRARARRTVRRLARAWRRRAGVAGPPDRRPSGRHWRGSVALQATAERPVRRRAAVDHRRAGADARLAPLARGAYVRGRAARRFDVRDGAGAGAGARAGDARRLPGPRHAPPLPGGSDDGRPQRRAPAGRPARATTDRPRDVARVRRCPPRTRACTRRGSDGERKEPGVRWRRLPVGRERHRGRPRRPAPRRGRRGGERLRARERQAPAPGARRAPPPAAATGARARRRAPRATQRSRKRCAPSC